MDENDANDVEQPLAEPIGEAGLDKLLAGSTESRVEPRDLDEIVLSDVPEEADFPSPHEDDAVNSAVIGGVGFEPGRDHAPREPYIRDRRRSLLSLLVR